jgi:hypothetical protein
MGRFLARNLVQQEHREREPIAPQRRFGVIAGGKLLDANSNPEPASQKRFEIIQGGKHTDEKHEPETSKTNLRVAHHISEKRHESSSGCRGLRIKHEGRWDQMWMVKWFEWYKYVVAFTRKVFDFSVSCAKGISETLRQDGARTAWV